jgi:hypothetical protein
MPVLRPSGSDFTSVVKAAAQYVAPGLGGKVSNSGRGSMIAPPSLGSIVRASQVGALSSPTTSVVFINGVTSPIRQSSSNPVFNPKTIAGLVLWLDGADPSGTGNTPSAGATIPTWVEKATANNAAVTGTLTYVSGGGVNFNGSSYMYNTNFVQNLSLHSMFVVYKTNVRVGFAGLLSLAPTPNTGLDWQTVSGIPFITDDAFSLQGDFFGGSYFIRSPDITNLQAVALYNHNMSNTTGSMYRNGSNVANSNAAYVFGTCSGYNVGGRWEGSPTLSVPFNGVIYDMLYFNTPLTLVNREKIEGYLAWKWGLQSSLPTGHTYKSAAPT